MAPDVEPAVFQLPRTLVEEMFAHARGCAPEECCGLLGGGGRRAANAYPLRNVAPRPEVAYEVAPEELFEAQRLMRARGETNSLACPDKSVLSFTRNPGVGSVRLK